MSGAATPSFLTVIQFFEGSKPDHTKSWLYAVCSLSYLGAMVSSNSALQYVNYPTQVSVSGVCVCGGGSCWVSFYPNNCLCCVRCWESPANPSQVNVSYVYNIHVQSCDFNQSLKPHRSVFLPLRSSFTPQLRSASVVLFVSASASTSRWGLF